MIEEKFIIAQKLYCTDEHIYFCINETPPVHCEAWKENDWEATLHHRAKEVITAMLDAKVHGLYRFPSPYVFVQRTFNPFKDFVLFQVSYRI